MSRYKLVSFEALEHMLLQIGFVHGYTTGQHKLYTHKETDTIIALPPSRPGELAQPIYIVAIRKQLIDRGLVDDDEFDRLLEQARRVTAQEQEQHALAPLSSAHP